MNVPALLAYLCDPTKLKYRPVAGEYIWADNELKPYRDINTPLYLAFSSDTSMRFTPIVNAQTGQFAKIAIEDQPMAYVRVVIDDTLHTFGWNRQPDPFDYYGNGPNFQFVSVYAMNQQIPWYATPNHIPGNPYTQPATIIQRASNTPTWCNASCQQGDPQAAMIMRPNGTSPARVRGSGSPRRSSPGLICWRATSGTSTCAVPCSASSC